MSLARLCAFLAITASTTASVTSRASPPPDIPVRVTEDLHQGCPRVPAMLERVRARLPRVRLAVANEPAIDVEVRVERRGGVSHGTVALLARGESGERTERTASSASCDRVLAALAIMAAIGLDEGHVPVRAAPTPPPPSPPPPSRAPSATLPVEAPKRPAPPTRSPVSVSRPKTEPPPRLAFAMGTSFELSHNRAAVFSPGFFGQIVLPLRFDPFLRVGIGRSYREEFVSARGRAGVAWSEATFAGCGDLVRQEALRAGPCVNAEVGAIEAVVNDPLPSRGRSRLWLTAGASARIAWRPLPALSFEIVGGVRAPLIRTQLFFEPLALVYEAPAVVPFVGTAVVAHLP